VIAALALGTALLVSAADGAPLPQGATARADANSQAAHVELTRKAHAGRIDVYFLGDSITRRWGTADKEYRELYANWRRNFFGWNAADFGWGGDTTWNVLWRIEHGELDGVNPRVIVLLAGTNDLSAIAGATSTQQALESTVAGVAAIVQTCRAKAPGATLVLTAIPPRTDRPELAAVIARANARIAALADGGRIRFIDLNHGMTAAGGAVAEGMLAPDGLHLAVAGYQVWADALRPILLSLLGPPAATDQAPPPSSNPGLDSRP
jgi:lysophospholipase L1-like esterase